MSAILTKTSASGRQYYFTGTIQLISTGDGECSRLLAGCGLLIGDAHVFCWLEEAQVVVDTLNSAGIGGATWFVKAIDDETQIEIEQAQVA